jgi:predicted phage terminase large subunit-like protein
MTGTSSAVARAKKIKAAKTDLRAFCNLIDPGFFRDEYAYQDELCGVLQQMYEKRLINPKTGEAYNILVINMPPGFGKSYTAQMFSVWAFGQNVRNKIISISYNQTLSYEFARGVRGAIMREGDEEDDEDYCVRDVFPQLKIKYGDSAMEKWALEGKFVYRSYQATSFDGTLTGNRANIVIIDDPIRNHKEAANDAVKDGIWRAFTDTLQSRVLAGGMQIVIQTRWATDDLAGRLIEDGEMGYGDRVFVLKMEALTEDSESGVSLCEGVYPTGDLLMKRRGISAEIWAANFMQVPIDVKGALYGEFKTYDAVDTDGFERLIAYVDTADEGADYLCLVVGGVVGRYGYVTDVYYTDAGMEVTEGEVARRLNEAGTREVIVESNNGGRGFARNVERLLKGLGNRRCGVTWFHQSKNKRTRIIVNAVNVMEQVVMPEGWEKRWPEFVKAIRKYQRKGRNEHDDAPDALTGFVEVVNGDVKGKGRMRIGKRSRLGI